jgi:hypothetical protein
LKLNKATTFAGVITLSNIASADIVSYVSESSMINPVTNHANFNALVDDQSLENYQEDGLSFDVNRNYFSWNAPGFDGSEMFYASTGSLELVDITLADGTDFSDIDMQISSGWSPDDLGSVYLWVQAFNDGNLVEEFDINSSTGDYVGFVGGGYDQIRIGSYATAEIRDLHDESQRNAIAIDNVRAGTFVPSPSGLITTSVGLLFVAGRRRR